MNPTGTDQLQCVEVLLRVDGRLVPVPITTIVTDRGEPGLPQIAAGLRAVAERLDAAGVRT